MAFSLLASASAGGLNGATTSAVDTTGAVLLVLAVAYQASVTVSDSKSNTWTPLTVYGATQSVQMFYCNPTSVGTGHTFTVSGAVAVPGFAVLAYSGAALSSPFDVENGAASASAATIQPGTVTPSQDNSLIVTAVGLIGAGHEGLTPTINLSFTRQTGVPRTGGSNFGCYIADLLQGSAAAVNPTWTSAGTDIIRADIAVFKPASAGIIINPITGPLAPVGYIG